MPPLVLPLVVPSAEARGSMAYLSPGGQPFQPPSGRASPCLIIPHASRRVPGAPTAVHVQVGAAGAGRVWRLLQQCRGHRLAAPAALAGRGQQGGWRGCPTAGGQVEAPGTGGPRLGCGPARMGCPFASPSPPAPPFFVVTHPFADRPVTCGSAPLHPHEHALCLHMNTVALQQ